MCGMCLRSTITLPVDFWESRISVKHYWHWRLTFSTNGFPFSICTFLPSFVSLSFCNLTWSSLSSLPPTLLCSYFIESLILRMDTKPYGTSIHGTYILHKITWHLCSWNLHTTALVAIKMIEHLPSNMQVYFLTYKHNAQHIHHFVFSITQSCVKRVNWFCPQSTSSLPPIFPFSLSAQIFIRPHLRLWVELCSLERYVQVLILCTCEWDLIWK